MRARVAFVIVMLASSIAAAQSDEWAVEISRVPRREALCSMEREHAGRCDVVGIVRGGAWDVSVIRPRVHGHYLGDETMKWHLYFESRGRRYGTTQPLHHEVTICTDETHVRMGGHDAFVLESMEAIDLVGAATPEIVVRWRESAGSPIAVHVCTVEGAAPRCTGPHPDGAVSRDAGGVRIGARLVAAP